MTSYCSDNPNGLIIESVETFFEDEKNEWMEWMDFFFYCMVVVYANTI